MNTTKTKTRPNTVDVIDTCTKRLAALKKYVPNATTTTIPINGETLKASDVIAIYQGSLDTLAALDTLRAQVKATMARRAAEGVTRQTADRALKAWVTNQFGADSQQAHDFGFPPPKKPVRTVAEKSQAVALNHATREARHTMGPKQKLQIKGTIVVPAAPAAPAIPTQPAPIATPAAGVGAAPSALNGVGAH